MLYTYILKTFKQFLDFYQCPIYYYPSRCGEGRESFIIMMYLDSGSKSPEYWIKRATAVLLNLSA